VEKEFGKDNVKDDPSTPGGWVCTIKHDKQKMLRAEAMMKGVRKEDAERGRIVQDAIEKESVTMPDGSVRPIYGHLLDGVRQKFKKGLRGTGRYGKAPSEYFGLQGSYGKYEQGPEGLTFVWNDGWEPTNLWAEKAVGDVQHDPDGNVWVRSGDDWVLESEV